MTIPFAGPTRRLGVSRARRRRHGAKRDGVRIEPFASSELRARGARRHGRSDVSADARRRHARDASVARVVGVGAVDVRARWRRRSRARAGEPPAHSCCRRRSRRRERRPSRDTRSRRGGACLRAVCASTACDVGFAVRRAVREDEAV